MYHQPRGKHEEKTAVISRLQQQQQPLITLPAIINQRAQPLTITKIEAPGSQDLVRLQITGTRMTKNDPCLVRQPRTSAFPRLGGANIASGQCLPVKPPIRCIRRGASWTTSHDHLQLSKFIPHANYRSENQVLVENYDCNHDEEVEESEIADQKVTKPEEEHQVEIQEDKSQSTNEIQPIQSSQPSKEKSRKEIICRFEIQMNRLILRGKGCSNLIYRRWNSAVINEVDTLIFVNVNFEEISPHIDKLNSTFHNLLNLEFHRASIHSLLQISTIGCVGYLHSLTLGEEENPVTQLSLWRRYTIYKISSLKWLNGVQVTAEECDRATLLFRGLPSAEKSPTKTCLRHLKKQRSTRTMSIQYEDEDEGPADANYETPRVLESANVNQQGLMEEVREDLSNSLLIHNLCQQYWPQVVEEIVEEAVSDFEDMDEHMRKCLEQFNIAKKCDKSKAKYQFLH